MRGVGAIAEGSGIAWPAIAKGFAVTALTMMLAPSVTGCTAAEPATDPTAPAFAEASAALQEFAAEDARIADVLSTLPTGAVEPEEAAEALDEIEGARLTTWYQERLLADARSALAPVVDDEGASQEAQRLASLQLEAVDALREVVVVQESYLATTEELFSGLSSDDPDEDALAGLNREIEAMRAELASAQASYAAAVRRLESYREGDHQE